MSLVDPKQIRNFPSVTETEVDFGTTPVTDAQPAATRIHEAEKRWKSRSHGPERARG
jgi:hypothetical protein